MTITLTNAHVECLNGIKSAVNGGDDIMALLFDKHMMGSFNWVLNGPIETSKIANMTNQQFDQEAQVVMTNDDEEEHLWGYSVYRRTGVLNIYCATQVGYECWRMFMLNAWADVNPLFTPDEIEVDQLMWNW